MIGMILSPIDADSNARTIYPLARAPEWASIEVAAALVDVPPDTLAHFATVTTRPKVFIADTVKGKGVSFMEGLACGDQTYHFHAGAPSVKDYFAATEELVGRVNGRLQQLGLAAVELASAPLPVRVTPANPVHHSA